MPPQHAAHTWFWSPVPFTSCALGRRSDSGQTALEMRSAVMEHLPDATIIIKSAAVADYHSRNVPQHKLKKTAMQISLELDPTPDILAEVGQKKGDRLLIGFRRRNGAPVEEARRKMESKNCDMVVANLVGQKPPALNPTRTKSRWCCGGAKSMPVARPQARNRRRDSRPGFEARPRSSRRADDHARTKSAAYLEFYQDLGFELLFRRPRPRASPAGANRPELQPVDAASLTPPPLPLRLHHHPRPRSG